MIDYSLRIYAFIFLISALLAWQWAAPRKPLQYARQRWSHNLGLFALDALLVRICQPLILTGVALLPSATFAPLTHLPEVWALIVSLILLDALIYWQHRLFHTVPWFWRLHRVHHSDPELDVSSAVRFHPLEILLSLAIKAVAIWLLGVPAAAVLLFDILLNGFAMFNHTNVHLKHPMDKWLRRLVVTPDMHRIHHSRLTEEANSNYGFCLSFWDRLFGSYTPDSQQGDQKLAIGMPGTRSFAPKRFSHLLTMPFSLFTKEKDSSS